MRKERLHTKPFITAGGFLAAGVILIALGFLLSDDPGMNNYPLAAFGLLFLIVAAVTFVMYGAIEKRYRNLLREGPLLRYSLPAEARQEQVQQNIDEIRSNNKALLMVMLFFCVLFAGILPIFVEKKLLLAAICLALAAWAVTSYRVRKLQSGGEGVILSRGGAFLEGAFHTWDLPGAGVTGLEYTPPGPGEAPGRLRIEYAAEAHPVSVTEAIVLLVPGELEERMPEVLQALEAVHG